MTMSRRNVPQSNGMSTMNIYHTGWIHVKTLGDRYREYYAQIKGQELHLFDDEMKAKPGPMNHVEEKLSLRNVQSVTMDSKKSGWNHATIVFPTISIIYQPECRKGEVRMRAKQTHEQDVWFRFLHTVCLGKIPEKTTTALLPGQIKTLEDIIADLSVTSDFRFRPNLLLPLPPTNQKGPQDEEDKEDEEESFYLPMNRFSSTVSKLPRRMSSSVSCNPIDTAAPAPVPPRQRRISLPTAPNNMANTLRGQFDNNRLMPAFPVNQSNSIPPTVPSRNRRFSQDSSPQTTPHIPFSTIHEQVPQKSWMYDKVLSRDEAEKILKKNEEFGNLMIRRRVPSNSQDTWSFAVSIKPYNTNVCKHFKVKEVDEGSGTAYIINLAGKALPRLPSLDDVVEYFVSESNNEFQPLSQACDMEENLYEQTIPSSWHVENQAVIPPPRIRASVNHYKQLGINTR